MPATHKSTTYKPLPLGNPFHEGQDRAFAEILVQNNKEKRRWQLVGIGVIVLSFINLIFFIIALSRQTTVPVLVNVMPTGEALYLGEVRQTSLDIPEEAVIFWIRKFITNLRSVSIDSQVLYDNIEETYSMITTSYEPILTRYLRANSPFEIVGRIRRTIEIESIIRTTGRSYQVDWTEISVELSGTPTRQRMRGIVTVRIQPPEPSTIRRNPLGIFIENFEWSNL